MNVANKPVIRKLTFRSLKAAKTRNIIAVCAIALTTVLFTSVFTLGGNMLNAIQEQTMRQVGTSAHGGLKMITTEQYENFAKSPLLKDISFNRFLALAENDALKKGHYEMNYFENKQAKWNFSFPSVGKMPQADNELVCSTITLNALGVPHEIGAIVPLTFSVGGRQYTEQFTLCGYWEGDAAASAHQIGLSESYVNAVIAENDIPSGDYAGAISADVWFSNAVDIEGKMERLIAERGYSVDDIAYGVNWAYAAGKTDPTAIAIAAFVLALILLSGYLIIYSIFAISVTTDIRFYGLLKTLGATGRQIRRVVRGQALILSVLGIPAGLIIGYIGGTLFVPLAARFMSFDSGSARSANPLIFVFSALFALLTVFISCRKPGKIAAKVSPVEAVKYSGSNIADKRKSKRTRAVTPFAFAWANITRDKKKLCVVVLSLSLSMILLNSVFSASQSFDLDEYVSRSIVGDFAVADYTIFSSNVSKNVDGVTSEFLREAEERGGKLVNTYYHATRDNQVYGIGKTQLRTFAKTDYDNLRSGNYAIVSRRVINYGETPTVIPNIGDTIKLTNADGEMRAFEVVELVDEYPYNFSAQVYFGNSLIVAVADEVFQNFYGETAPMQTNIIAENVAEFETWLNEYTDRDEPNLDFVSRETLKAEFAGLRNTYVTIGGCLAFVLALIGVLNFTNAIVASIYARRREFAMLQSVGMTGRQLKTTLLFEGGGYTVLTAALTATIGFGLTYFITLLIAGQAWFFKQNVTILPSIVCLPLLVILCAAVPVICYSKLTRESVVERLREE